MIHFFKRLIQNIFWAIIIFATVYGFLALCNWHLNPSTWNGFSRFLVAVSGLIVVVTTWKDMNNTVRDIRATIVSEHARIKNEEKQKLWQLDETRPGE